MLNLIIWWYSLPGFLLRVFLKSAPELTQQNKPNKLFQIQPVRSDPLPRSCRNRKEESVLTRLHIGHTYITHRHRLRKEAEPICIGCDEPLTVEHILVRCWDLYEIRRKHYSVENFKVLFRDVPPDKIFDFLKEVGLFYKIWKILFWYVFNLIKRSCIFS